MRILIYSRAFLPHIGGLEINVAHLAEELQKHDCEITVATVTPGEGPDRFSYRVLRQPSPLQLLREVRACDVYHQPNLSLRGLWPLLLVRRPWVVSHHSWYAQSNGHVNWRDRLKKRLVRYADGSIAVSQAIADALLGPSTVVPNAYRDDLFRRLPNVPRDQDLLFVGRLVSDKGVDVLLDALALLRRDGLAPSLTIVGIGPEESRLRQHTSRLGLTEQVTFAGLKQGQELVETYNRYRIAVVPSRYNEPFGIVALEAIACGCVVVGSAGGGLPEAIGPCGLTFPNGDAEALAARLAELLRHPARIGALLAGAEDHLASHRSPVVFSRYFEVLRRAGERRAT